MPLSTLVFPWRRTFPRANPGASVNVPFGAMTCICSIQEWAEPEEMMDATAARAAANEVRECMLEVLR